MAAKELVDNALDAAETADRLPEVTVTATGNDGEGTLTLTVADNGPGIPDHVVEQILDFDHRVSDKCRYQTPSRGQQGNALKGIVGIAAVLGGRPVVIKACGVRHQIGARLLADHVLPTHHQTPTPTPTRIGTTVTLTVHAAAQQLDLPALAAGYALANPHVTITVSVDAVVSRLTDTAAGAIRYMPTANRCGKYSPRPDRFGAPAWYDADSFAGLVLATAELPHPPPLGAFLRSFDGLTSTARAKAVTSMLPVTSLAELRNRLDLVPKLLAVMQAQAAPTPPSKLGPIGRAHLHHTLDEAYTIDGAHWYKKVDIAVGGVPWLLEVMVAQTAAPARFHWLVNHTPVFADPLLPPLV